MQFTAARFAVQVLAREGEEDGQLRVRAPLLWENWLGGAVLYGSRAHADGTERRSGLA